MFNANAVRIKQYLTTTGTGIGWPRALHHFSFRFSQSTNWPVSLSVFQRSITSVYNSRQSAPQYHAMVCTEARLSPRALLVRTVRWRSSALGMVMGRRGGWKAQPGGCQLDLSS